MKTNLYKCLLLLAFIFAGALSVKAAGPYYYRVGATDPTVKTNWTTSASGSGGTSPTSFTVASVTWNFYNSAGTVNGTLSTNWILGTNNTVKVGNGTLAATLNFAAFTVNKAVDVRANATVTSSNTNPTFMGSNQFTYNGASTCIFSANGVTVPTAGFSVSYGNLTLSGTTATLGGAVTVSGIFTSNALVMNGQTLELDGGISSMGNITGDASATIIITNGSNFTLNMDQTTVGTTNVLNTVSYDDGGAGNTMTLGNALYITPGGVITPVSGTIDFGSARLTLMAVKGLTGGIGPIVSPGAVSGTIISKVVHNPSGNKTDYTMMGSPGINAPSSVFSAWNNAFSITCASCPNGSTASGQAFTSIDFYDETQTGGGDYNNAAHYIDITSISDALNPGVGVWVYEGNSSPGTSTGAENISVTGAPFTGSLSPTVTKTNSSNGYNLLANPYPCPISWDGFINFNTNSSKVDATLYVYSPNTGGYSTYLSGAGVSNPSTGSYSVGDLIPTGGAFYVLATGAASVDFDESQKATPPTSQDLLRQAQPNAPKTTGPKVKVKYFSIQAACDTMNSEAAFIFDANATTSYDRNYDAYYLGNSIPGALALTSLSNGSNMAINGMPDLTQNYSIPVHAATGATGTYTFSALNLQYMPAGACLILHDNLTNTDHDLRNGNFVVTLNNTDASPRFTLNVTIAPLTINTTSSLQSCPSAHDAYLTAIGTNAGPWNYTWKDVNHNIIKTTLNTSTADTLKSLATGTYYVDVNTVGTCDNATQTFNLGTGPMPSSSFIPSATSVLVGSTVTFTNTSASATSYWWNFGDGNTSNLQDPSYSYAAMGSYDVTLLAIDNCQDTVSSQQTITVSATTGLKSAGSANGDIIISRDGSGNYLQFDYAAETKIAISVYNVLGQTVLNNSQLTVMNDKVYLNIPNNKDQVLYVTIINLSSGKQLTRKFVNQ